MRLFCDCKTDEEKSNFFLSGRAVETGVIAPAISNDVAMAYHRCAQFKKENDALRARIEAMEKQEPVAWMDRNGTLYNTVSHVRASDKPLYLAPGAQNVPVEQDAAHQKALAASALRVAEGWERKCGELRAKIGRMEKRLHLILEEPENTMSNSKAMREMIKQARLALEKSK